MPPFYVRAGIVSLLVVTTACSGGRVPEYVAPSNETVEAGTEMNYGGDGQFVYVINHSSAPVTITGLQLTECENIKNRCDPMQLRVHVAAGHRENLVTVQPKNPSRAYTFRFRYTWEPTRETHDD